MSEIHYYIVELDLPEVVGACTKGGVNGFSTPLTCADQDSPTTVIKTHSFTDTGLILNESDIFKCIKSVSETTPKLKAGNGLASMATCNISFQDFIGDPNKTSPALIDNPSIIEKGTFFGKLKARNILVNKKVRVKHYRRYNGAFELVRTNNYIASDLKNTGGGNWNLTCKDVLYKTDDEKAQFPKVVTGRLLSDLTEIQTSVLMEADVADWSSFSQYVAVINKEIMIITDATGDAVQTTLTVVRANSILLGSRTITNTVQEHDSGDEVFRGRIFANADLYDVIEAALLDASMDVSEFDGVEMQTELNTWLANLTGSIDCIFYEAGDTNKVLGNICKTFLLDMFTDIEVGKMKLRATSPWNSTASVLTEGKEITYKSVRSDESKDLYHSRAFLQYDKRLLTESDDDTNYSRSSLGFNSDLEGSLFYGDEKLKKIGKSIILSNKIQNIEAGDLTVIRSVQRWSNRPEYISFEIEESKINFKLADVIEVISPALQNDEGDTRQNVRAQVIQISPTYAIGRKFKVSCVTYNPFIGGVDGSDISVNSQYDINLYTQAGGPISADTYNFTFDSLTYGQNKLPQAIAVGSFPTGSVVNIICLGGARIAGLGGGGGGGGRDFAGGDGQKGGLTILGTSGVTVNFYLSGNTGDLGNGSYTADGYLYAPGGGGGGGDGLEVDVDGKSTWVGGGGGGGGAGFFGGNFGRGGNGIEGGDSGNDGNQGSIDGGGLGGTSTGKAGGNGGGFGESGSGGENSTSIGGLSGDCLDLNGGTINIFTSGNLSRFIQGSGDSPSSIS